MISCKTDRLEQSIDLAIKNVKDQKDNVSSATIQQAKFLNEVKK